VRIVFQLTPETEAPAEMNFFFPDRGWLCAAENFTHTMHKLVPIRVPDRRALSPERDTGPMAASFDDLAATIRARRTHMLVQPDREVPGELVSQLCELATWAPCHKRTWPWRFALCTGEGRARLGQVAATAMAACGADAAKVAKTRTKYLRTPAVLVVGSVPGDSPLRTAENRDAVSAGVQNLLLGATAAGLATYWSSCPAGAEEAVAELCGFDPGTAVVAIIYLGWARAGVEAPARPPVQLVQVT
jgi:nitroreductase